MSENCPCGRAQSYKDCCAPFIEERLTPQTAEDLMRSRYSAYVKCEIPYIAKTHFETARDEFDFDSAKSWAENSEWLGLEVVKTEGGGPEDSVGMVEFAAKFKIDDQLQCHREKSKFVKIKGKWLYKDGKIVAGLPQQRERPKVGRNDPCHCGSGKKFKKCCWIK
jgi:SEC-C motif-containing protein